MVSLCLCPLTLQELWLAKEELYRERSVRYIGGAAYKQAGRNSMLIETSTGLS